MRAGIFPSRYAALGLALAALTSACAPDAPPSDTPPAGLVARSVIQRIFEDYPRTGRPPNELKAELAPYGPYDVLVKLPGHAIGFNENTVLVKNPTQFPDWLICVRYRSYPDGRHDPITIEYQRNKSAR
jgi:hypothetical protein